MELKEALVSITEFVPTRKWPDITSILEYAKEYIKYKYNLEATSDEIEEVLRTLLKNKNIQLESLLEKKVQWDLYEEKTGTTTIWCKIAALLRFLSTLSVLLSIIIILLALIMWKLSSQTMWTILIAIPIVMFLLFEVIIDIIARWRKIIDPVGRR